MAESKEGYWRKHHTGVIQCVLGLYCAALSTSEYLHPHSNPAPVPPARAAMNPGYSMPWYLWAGITALAFSVIVPAVVGMIRKRRAPRLLEEFITAEREEIQRLKDSLHETARSNLEYRGERDQCEEKKRELQKRLDDMFTPLQLEAIQLSKELGDFMKRIGDRPSVPPGAGFDGIFYDSVRGQGYKWGIKMQAAYEAEMSPRVNAFISHLELETGRLNTRLRNYKDHVHDFENINTIRAQLWLEVMYPLDIDFTGER